MHNFKNIISLNPLNPGDASSQTNNGDQNDRPKGVHHVS